MAGHAEPLTHATYQLARGRELDVLTGAEGRAAHGPRAEVAALSPGERPRFRFASQARPAAHRRARPSPARLPPVRPRPRHLDHASHGRAAYASTSRTRFVKTAAPVEDVS